MVEGHRTDLEAEVRQLSEALLTRAGIDQAKGLIMGIRRCNATTALHELTTVSQNTNIKLRTLAQTLVLAADLNAQVDATLDPVLVKIVDENWLNHLGPRRPPNPGTAATHAWTVAAVTGAQVAPAVSKGLLKIVNALEDQGFDVETTSKGHLLVTQDGLAVATFSGTALEQAIDTALAAVGQNVGTVTAIEVMTSDDFDAGHGLDPLPELMSVTEAAAELGVSRQAVLQRLLSGSLLGTKVGSTWAIQRAALT